MPSPSWERVLWPDPVDGPWDLVASYLPVRGRYELVGLSIELSKAARGEPRALTTTLLRSIVPGSMAAAWRARQRSEGPRLLERLNEIQAEARTRGLNAPPVAAGEPLPEDGALDEHGRKRPGRQPYWHGARLERIAEIYQQAWREGDRPTQAVARHFHMSRSLAAKLVARCRRPDVGLLPPTTTGRAQGTPE